MQKLLGLLALLFAALASPISFSQLFNPVATLSSPRSAESVFDNSGQPWSFLNQINAVNYDNGGQGIAFSHAYTSGNCTAGTAYRPDFTNFNAINDSGATFDIGCFSTVGDFLNYTVNVTSNGPFVLNVRAGDGPGAGAAGASWSVLIDNAQTTTIQLADTGGYQTFQTFTSGQFNLAQGQHVIKLRCAVLDAGGGCGDLVYLQGALPQAVGSCSSTFVSARLSGRADLNNCVRNWDFDNAPYTTTANSWFVPFGSSATGEWYNVRNCGIGPTPPPSSLISVLNDPAAGGGGNVLNMHWDQNNYYDNPPGGGCDRQVIVLETRKGDGSTEIDFPSNYYLEAKVAITVQSPSCPSGAFDGNGNCTAGWEVSAIWGTASTGVTSDFYERDFLNYFANNPANGVGILQQSILWGAGTDYGPSGGPPNISDGRVYHTVGVRTTSDGGTIRTCYYFDSSTTLCGNENTAHVDNGFNPFAARLKLILQVGPTRTYSYDYRIKYIRVWSCTGYQSSLCQGSVLQN